ncbi:MAG: hypothetical protein AMJ79_05570 [Phycisphaerae bacterium SM23_30]|nr:MAG: hypothetical protein AMJ79_05570 [Phycisphaerae bacterium SM23_30]
MAVAKTTSEPSKSMFIAMGILVVLFLAATAVSVVMFMGRTKLINDKETAEQNLDRIANPMQVSELRSLSGQAGATGPTAIDRVTEDMQYLTGVIAGERISQPALGEIRGMVETELEPIWQDLENAVISWHQQANQINEISGQQINLVAPQLLDSNQGLAHILKTILGQTTDLMNRFGETQILHRQEMIDLQNRVAGQQDAILKLTETSNVATSAAQDYKLAYDSLLGEKVGEKQKEIDDLSSRYSNLEAQEAETRLRNAELTREIEQYKNQVKNLNERLQQFQPNPEMEMAAFEPDGVITLVVPPPPAPPEFAYINLGENDHIYRGLTFSVYDSYKPFANRETGQGKGSLEVIEIVKTVARCRIVDYNKANPIRENDIIANLVWARDKKYRFCVTGEFDFDGDEKIDDDGYERITKLIEQWGGQVTPTVSVDTDFLVVGQPPKQPEPMQEDFTISSEELMKSFQEAQARVEHYNKNRADGAALGVPTFNRSRFLYFIGYYKQAKGAR